MNSHLNKRLTPADYCDGRQSPRCARSKRPLPSEREISLAMGNSGRVKENSVATYAFTAWGQFLTHDIIQTPDVGGGDVPCNCNPHKDCKNIDVPRKILK